MREARNRDLFTMFLQCFFVVQVTSNQVQEVGIIVVRLRLVILIKSVPSLISPTYAGSTAILYPYELVRMKRFDHVHSGQNLLRNVCCCVHILTLFTNTTLTPRLYSKVHGTRFSTLPNFR